jgi:hypothetical protein
VVLIRVGIDASFVANHHVISTSDQDAARANGLHPLAVLRSTIETRSAMASSRFDAVIAPVAEVATAPAETACVSVVVVVIAVMIALIVAGRALSGSSGNGVGRYEEREGQSWMSMSVSYRATRQRERIEK